MSSLSNHVLDVVRAYEEVPAANRARAISWDEIASKVEPDPAWRGMVNDLFRAWDHEDLGPGDNLYDFNKILSNAAWLYQGAMTTGVIQPPGEGAALVHHGPQAMVGALPRPRAEPSTWVAALDAQKGTCRAWLTDAPTSRRTPGGARNGSQRVPGTSTDHASAQLIRARIAAYYAIPPKSGGIENVPERELKAWLSNPHESVKMALSGYLWSVARGGPMLDRIVRSLVESAITSGVRWTTALEYVHARTWHGLSETMLAWKTLLNEHRERLIAQTVDIRPFLGMGTIGRHLYPALAERNQYLDSASILLLCRDNYARMTTADILVRATANPSVSKETIVDCMVGMAPGEQGLTWPVIRPLRSMAFTPGGIPHDPRLLDVIRHIDKEISADDLDIILRIPGAKDLPGIAELLKRERTPRILAMLMRDAEPKEFGRLLGRLLTATSRVLKTTPPPGQQIDLEGIISSATPEQLSGVPMRVWTRALQHREAPVRLAAMTAMNRAAKAEGEPSAKRKATSGGQRNPRQ